MQWIRRGGHFQVTILTTSTLNDDDDRSVSLGFLLDSFTLSSVLCVPHRSCRTILGKPFTEHVRCLNDHL